jgi:hypothetical protein
VANVNGERRENREDLPLEPHGEISTLDVAQLGDADESNASSSETGEQFVEYQRVLTSNEV